MDDEEDDHDEDGGDTEPSLGWTVNGSLTCAAAWPDGEQGDLALADLDALRAKRRAAKSLPAPDGSDGVLVTLRGGKVVGPA